MQVHKFLRNSLLPLILGIAVAATLHHKPPALHVVAKPVTIQQRAEHRIKFEGSSLCTATAVGSHAILTAVHCNTRDISTVTLDMSVRKFHILSKTTDGRDHVVYILDGQKFLNYIPLESGVHPARTSEHVYIYGAGGGIYPLQYKDGFKTTAVTDVSEVDQEDGLNFYTIPVIPGDSGSAIFGMDGRIIAVTTYKMSVPKDGNWDSENDNDFLSLDAAFDVNFTPAQVSAIAVGHGDTPLDTIEDQPRRLRSLFDLFGN